MAQTSSQQSYLEVIKAILQYYNSSEDVWENVSKIEIPNVEAENILSQLPSVEIVKNTDGTIRSYNYATIESVSNTALSSLNSNTATRSVKNNIPANMNVNTSTGNVTMKSGLATAGNFVMGSVLPAVSAAGIAITLGKTIDKVLYETLPYIFDVDKSEIWSLNPDTWSSITSEDDSIGATVFNTVFQINDDSTSQMYLDENALAYLSLYMQNQGFFSSAYQSSNIYNDISIKSYFNTPIILNTGKLSYITRSSGTKYFGILADSDVYTLYSIIGNSAYRVSYSTHSFNYREIFANTLPTTTNTSAMQITYNDYTFYMTGVSNVVHNTKEKYNAESNIGKSVFSYTDAQKIGYVILNSLVEDSKINGVGTQAGATTPDLSNATSLEDVLALLKMQFPQLWENAVTQDVVQPDGSVKVYVYVPIATPDAVSASDPQPVTGEGTQDNPVVNPDTSPEPLLDLIISILNPDPTPQDENNESEIGKGSTPSLIVPVGSASALYKIYNPTQEQLNSFGAWLWSNDFVDQLLKMFNDPMQAIIGLHKVYSPVSVGGTTDIKVGYLSSGVTSNYISEQYVTVDCGSINLSEFFNNVFDYDPFTKVYIYLPFIGIQQLHTGDVMRSSINVKYHVDVLTGTCLAEINITRDGGGGILYTYSGNCAVQYPLSSGNYMGLIGSLASVAGSVAGAVISGGALTPMALGAISGLSHAHTNVSHSGNFSGNAGAMGVKIPYLIITRPQTELANTFPHNDGYPVNYSTTVGQCSGYIEVESVHVENIPATESELIEIENLLKSGVLV